MISDVVILDFQTMNFNLLLICNAILRYFYMEHPSREGPIHDILSISIDSFLKVNIKDVHSDGFYKSTVCCGDTSQVFILTVNTFMYYSQNNI